MKRRLRSSARKQVATVGEHTAISWCDHTFNAWEGCEKVSPGCKNCYAATLNGWLHGGENWEPGGPRRFFGDAHWKKPISWNSRATQAGVRRRVFCSSLADVFEIRGNRVQDAELDAERERLWRLIAKTPNLDWLLLTKRPENLAGLLPWINLAIRPREPRCRDCADFGPLCPSDGRPCDPHEPWPNVWIGTTAENDEYAKRRIPILRSTPAAVRFVSYEPEPAGPTGSSLGTRAAAVDAMPNSTGRVLPATRARQLASRFTSSSGAAPRHRASPERATRAARSTCPSSMGRSTRPFRIPPATSRQSTARKPDDVYIAED